MTVLASIDSPSIALAFSAGFVSFISPCVLPLVPGYLAVLSPDGALPREGRVDRRLLIRAGAFVATFSVIYILIGTGLPGAGRFLYDNQPELAKIGGILMIVMGLLFVGSVFFLRLNRELHVEGLLRRAGQGGPVVAGAAFALAWTPCQGPTIGAIISLSITDHSYAHSMALMAIYSAGLAIPFLFFAVAYGSAQRVFAFFRRHAVAIQVGSGLVLIAVGVLVYDGEFARLNNHARDVLDALGLDRVSEI
jgi:cytochrome c-type biogenesis protein